MAIEAPCVVSLYKKPTWQQCVDCLKWRQLPMHVDDLRKRGIVVRDIICESVRLTCDVPQLLTDEAIDFWLERRQSCPKTYWVQCDDCNLWRCIPEDKILDVGFELEEGIIKAQHWACCNFMGLSCDIGQVLPTECIQLFA